MQCAVRSILATGLVLGLCAPATAQNPVTMAMVGATFIAHCFSPYLTAQKAQDAIGPTGARVEFYDLDPFSTAAPSPVTGRAATPGTDRRCEVSVDGEMDDSGAKWIVTGLRREGLHDRVTDVPTGFTEQPGATFVAAAQLNPNRIAVVQAGTRPGPNGPETYMSVERLTPLDGT